MNLLTAEELKERITEDEVRLLLEIMGATWFSENDTYWITDTVCHGGNKPKLYYYKLTKTFHCYTECGSMDIIGLVMHYKDFTSDEFPKAIQWIKVNLKWQDYVYGQFGKPTIGKIEKCNDWTFINRWSKKSKRQKIADELVPDYDERILKIFHEKYSKDWIDEGISIQSMKKYNIKYCNWQQKIIIPHRDRYDRLIGVRGRNVIPENEESFGKYSPFRLGDYYFSHPLGKNLYGLNFNLEAIQRKRKIMIVEGEKSVLQTDTMFGEDNFTVAVCGSNLSEWQRKTIIELAVDEVIIALDKQYQKVDTEEYDLWIEHIFKHFIKPLVAYVKVTVLLDTGDLLGYKDSPTDKGKETLLKLMDSKIYVSTIGE